MYKHYQSGYCLKNREKSSNFDGSGEKKRGSLMEIYFSRKVVRVKCTCTRHLILNKNDSIQPFH